MSIQRRERELTSPLALLIRNETCKVYEDTSSASNLLYSTRLFKVRRSGLIQAHRVRNYLEKLTLQTACRNYDDPRATSTVIRGLSSFR